MVGQGINSATHATSVVATEVRPDGLATSQAFFFQIEYIEPMIDHPVAWDELCNIILHILLGCRWQVAQTQVALVIIPNDDISAGSFFGVLANPCGHLVVRRAG